MAKYAVERAVKLVSVGCVVAWVFTLATVFDELERIVLFTAKRLLDVTG